jgi:hypothetical protein
MTTELIGQLKDFEIFVEKIEKMCEEVKESHLVDKDGNKYQYNHFDLRDNNGYVVPLPKNSLEDYFEIWNYVQERYKKYLDDYDNPIIPNAMYLDLYWNDVENNCAYYDDLAIWIYFDYEYGIYYDTDTEIIEKINKRDNN